MSEPKLYKLGKMLERARQRHADLTSPLSTEEGLPMLVMRINADLLNLIELLLEEIP